MRVGLLYDYYGALLTVHQREAIDLYYLQNWSLQEIAEAWRTSRQAVHDLVNRSVHLLETYEGRLGIEARDRKIRDTLWNCANLIEEARVTVGSDDIRARDLISAAVKALAGLLGVDEDLGGGGRDVS